MHPVIKFLGHVGYAVSFATLTGLLLGNFTAAQAAWINEAGEVCQITNDANGDGIAGDREVQCE